VSRIALVTASAARHLDEDLPPLERALEQAGARPEIVVWDDGTVDWAGFDLVVVRSTWDYVARRDELLAWAEAVEAVTALVNPAAILRWSTDKHYLADLAAAGVPVPPTRFLHPGDDVAESLADAGEVVVKPAIGAGSIDTQRYLAERGAEAIAHAERLLADGRDILVQPYLGAVDDHGETAVVLFGGELSHAIRKGPILRPDGTVFVEGLYAEEQITARAPTPEELAVARAALAAVPRVHGPLAYARVDIAPGPDASPVVLELELAEPSVFLAHADGAAERFAATLVARATAVREPRPH
jgi:O-ureido-D-serine cyclo-ligase